MIQLKRPFFSRRNLLVMVLILLLLYCLLWCGSLIDHKLSQDRNLRAAKAREVAKQNLSKEEQSILKATNYFTNSITTVGTSERIFLSYLQRQFELPTTLGAEGPPIDLYEDPRTYPAEVHYLARIAYPDRVVNVPPKYELDDGVKVTNIYSANCDHLTLPANYWQTMQQNISTGGYYAAHVALAFALMKDNGCDLPPNADNLKHQTTDALVTLADSSTTLADLRYEAVAFLLLSERRDLIKPQWIDQIMHEQRADGGWSRQVGESRPDPHASLLALWSLLEYSRPNTPAVPLIRRPSTDSIIR